MSDPRSSIALIDGDPCDWTVVVGDCCRLLGDDPIVAPGSVRLVFADPPYNLGVDYGADHDDRLRPKDYLEWSRAWIHAAAGTLARDGSLWVLINHEWAARIELILCDEVSLKIRNWITWYETFGVNCTRKFNRCSRRLLHAVVDPKRSIFNASAVRRPSDRLAKYNDKRANPLGKLLDDVWEIPRVAGTFKERQRGFPTQLPLELMTRVVGCASNPGDLVLDPFSGSATTGVASIQLGRRYIGIEKSETFAAISRKRLEVEPRMRHAVLNNHGTDRTKDDLNDRQRASLSVFGASGRTASICARTENPSSYDPAGT